MATPKKTDWLEAQKYYLLDSTVTLADVAKKFGVSNTTVEKRASDEGWVNLRKSIGENALLQFSKELAAKKAVANDRHLKAFQKATDAADKMLDTPGMTPKELQAAVGALKNAIEGERVVLGLPTSVSVHQDPDGKPVVPVTIWEFKRKDDGDGDHTSAPENQPQTS